MAEIKRRKKELIELSNDFTNQWACGSLDNILSFLDTIEAKEVDFGTEGYKYIDEHFNVYDDTNLTLQTKENRTLLGVKDFEDIAKHFFELGINAQEMRTEK